MEIKYNVQAPPKKAFNGGAKSEEVKAIEDFLTSGNAKNMCFEYGTEKEAKTKLPTVSSHKRKWNEKNPKKYDAYRVGNCIYIVRLTGKKCQQQRQQLQYQRLLLGWRAARLLRLRGQME